MSKIRCTNQICPLASRCKKYLKKPSKDEIKLSYTYHISAGCRHLEEEKISTIMKTNRLKQGDGFTR